MEKLLLVLFFVTTLYPQYNDAIKLYDDFIFITQSIDTSESCQLFKIQLSNAFDLAMQRNSESLKEILISKDDILKLFDNFLILFVRNNSTLVKKLLFCTDESSSIFDAQTIGWKLILYALYDDPRNYLRSYESFDLLTKINFLISSNDEDFNNWSPDKVRVSNKPIEYKIGSFYERGTSSNAYYFTRDGNSQTEYHAKINDMSSWNLSWNNQFEYELTFQGNDSGLNMFDIGDKVICRIIEVTDSSYKAIVKTKYCTISGELLELSR